MTYDIAVIGAGGFLGRRLVETLTGRGLSVLRVTSRQADAFAADTLVWTYGTPPPAALQDSSVWINCAFNLASGWGNLANLTRLLDARTDQSFVQISTNAVLSYDRRPEDTGCVYRKGGEDYARIKSAMDRQVMKHVPKGRYSLVYPTIVVGKDAEWDRILKTVAAHTTVRLKDAGQGTVDRVDIDDAVTQIADLVAMPSLDAHRILRSQPQMTWQALVAQHARDGHMPDFTPLPTQRAYFDNGVMNTIFRILTHPLLPDRLAVWLFKKARRGAPAHDAAPKDVFCPTGPTRFYMSQVLKAE